MLRASKWVQEHFRRILDFILYHQAESSKRGADAASRWEDVRRQRIENLSATLNVSEKLPEKYRDAFVENIMTSIGILENSPVRHQDAKVTDDDQPTEVTGVPITNPVRRDR